MADLGKRYVTLLVFAAAQLALGALFCAPARADYWEESPKKTFLIKTRVRYWFSSSFSETRFDMVTPASWWIPPADNIRMGYTDTFRGMDSSFPLFSVEMQPFSGFSGELEAGDNRLSGGQFLEHSWLNASNYTITFLNGGEVWENPHYRDYALRTAKTNGTASIRPMSTCGSIKAARFMPRTTSSWSILRNSLLATAGMRTRCIFPAATLRFPPISSCRRRLPARWPGLTPVRG